MTYHRRNILLGAILTSLIMVVMTFVGNVPWPLRTIFAIPFVLVLPGYAMIVAIAPSYRFGLVEELLLSLGLSIVLSIVGAFVLNTLPGGLSVEAWAVYLGLLTTGLSTTAYFRLWIQIADDTRHIQPELSPRQIVIFAAAAAIVVVAWMIARTGAERLTPPGETQFWMVPDESQVHSVKIGILSREPSLVHYKLQLYDGTIKLMEWPDIAVDTDQEWNAGFTFPPNMRPTKIDARLYRLDLPSAVPFRTASYFYQSLETQTPVPVVPTTAP
jgi:hypothetical protein